MDYARKWIKREKEEVDSLSEWAKAVRSLIQIQIGKKQKTNEYNSNICIQRF
jgi:hypothetical protein